MCEMHTYKVHAHVRCTPMYKVPAEMRALPISLVSSPEVAPRPQAQSG
jgi:hypothetical protein